MFVYIVYIQFEYLPPKCLNLYFLLEPNVLDVWYFARVLTCNIF